MGTTATTGTTTASSETTIPAENGIRSRTLPFDIHAERAILGRSLTHPRFHREARLYLDADDLWLPEHRRLWHALDQLDDIGDWLGPEWTDTTWRPVLADRVRAAAAALLADCEHTTVAGLIELSGDLRTNATTIRDCAERRQRILALERDLNELAS